MTKRTQVFIIIAAILLTSIGIYGYLKIRKLEVPTRDALDGIPKSAFCLISSNNIRDTWSKLNQGNLVWDALLETEWAKQVSQSTILVDSLLNTDEVLKSIFENRQCWLSLHFTGNEELDYLISTSLSSTDDDDNYAEFVKKHVGKNKIITSVWKESTILEIGDPSSLGFCTSVNEGVILISSNKELLKTALEQLEKGATLKNDKSFYAVHQTAGEKATARIYFNYSKMALGLKRYATKKFHDRIADIARFAEWTEMDLSLRSNAVLMNGYTSSPDSINEFLGVFKGQQPQLIEVATVLPGTTICYSSFGISNFQLYNQRYETFLDKERKSDERADKLTRLKQNYNFDPNKQIANWIGNEIVMAIVPNLDGTASTIALLSCTNTDVAKSTLQALEGEENDSIASEVVPDSSGYVFRKLPVPEMLPTIFGEMFADLTTVYYTTIQQYVVFAENENSLRAIVEANQNKTTLVNNRAYADFQTNMSKEANLSIYVSPEHCESLLKENAGIKLIANLNLHPGLLRRFDGAILQYSTGDNDLFYTNVFIRHNPQSKEDITSLWETQLDTSFSSKPYLVINHKTKGLDIFIQDDANKIYLISNTGSIYWKKQLPEKIMGDVKQVDALKNGKLQLVFNTLNSIYIIDRNGNNFAPFPIKLPSAATNSMCVIDYENKHDYRLLIACRDKNIYNYSATGKKIEGWKIPTTQDLVIVPVERVVVGEKDYVIIADQSGKIYVTDRQGNTRLMLKEKLNTPVNKISVEAGKDLARTKIISADSNGTISRLSLTDGLERMHFMNFENAPAFEYVDTDGDGNREFIFIENKQLMVFNQDKSLVTSFTFDSPQDLNPQIFFFGSKDVRIGVLCPASKEIHLINNAGKDAEGFPIQGSTAFNIGSLNGDGSLTIICGNNNKYLCAYTLH